MSKGKRAELAGRFERVRSSWFDPAQSGWPAMLTGILLLAYALRVAGLLSESLWIDEGYSWALANSRLADVVRGTAADQHPPFYYLVLWIWLSLGRTLFSLRYLSALIGTLGVVAGAWVGRELLGKRVGLVTGLLLACSPMHIWYSQEARMYILLALLVTFSAGFCWRLVRGERGWLPYLICTVLALYTHYFALFVVLAENVFMLAWLGLSGRQDNRMPPRQRLLYKWLGVQAALVLVFSLWLPVAVYQARFHQMSWVAPPSLFKLAGTALAMVLGDAGLGPLGAAALAALGAAIVWSAWREQRAGRWEVIEGYAFALNWLAVPFATVALLSLIVPLFQVKQMLMLLPPLLILSAAALIRLPRPAQVVLTAVLAWLVVRSLGTMYQTETKDGWREAAAYLQSHYRPGDVIYLNPAAGALVLDAYLAGTLPREGYPPEYDVRTGGWEGEPVTAAVAEREMTALAADYGRVWLVEFVPEFWDAQGYLRAWLEENGSSVSEQRFSEIEVRLYRFAREPS